MKQLKGKLLTLICLLLIIGLNLKSYAADGDVVTSPDGLVQLKITLVNHQLYYSVIFKNTPVVEISPVNMTVDNTSITNAVTLGKFDRYSVNETYPWNGAHSKAINHFNGAKITVSHKRKLNYTFDVRVFNNGAAYRIIVPGKNQEKRVPDEATLFKVPAGSTIWYHDLNGHYESIYLKKQISEVREKEWAGSPLTYKLSGSTGYVSITEANLKNYSGMALQADGKGGFAVRLAHHQQTSHPYKLRYTPEDTLRLRKPAAVMGMITTPWRVVMVGADLNTMVNNDMVSNLCPPPDEKLFPQGVNTEWIKPGRAVWRYLDTPEGEQSTSEVLAQYSKQAGELGFEHNILEGFWSKWTDEEIKELVRISKENGVSIWLWKNSKDLWDAKERQAFFKRCADLGIAGVKLDFFDHEHKEVVDFYQTILKETAENKLLVDFHGSNKPTGESRTWPNELTRESVKGMETRAIADRATHHTTIPFTRWLAGHAEYTPVHFADIRRRNTTYTHQIASAAILSAPLLTYSANPKTLLSSPAVEMIKSIPSTWDETIVLPGSEIGELAAYARRKGNTWFVAVLNGVKSKTFSVPLSFLAKGSYKTLVIKDSPESPVALKVENASYNQQDSLTIQLSEGGGFIAKFQQNED